jgi:hypothetical protein
MSKKNNKKEILPRIIYMIVKPSDPMTVYIGQTSLSRGQRLEFHFYAQKYKPNMRVYQWLDRTCDIIEIEKFIGVEDRQKEMSYVWQKIAEGYTVTNTYLKIRSDDPEGYIREQNRLAKENGKLKVSNDKNTPKHNANKTQEYNNWRNNIYNNARKDKLKLPFKELLIHYNIPPFTGQKTKTDLPCVKRPRKQ